ncbi:serine/arginine repetitive matrix protein 4 isoform X2 [Heliangelus exortis]|uniref:serine/arginine repetitive matrix protein 4 isoform X2 n=1 Tax=Heliangelus exortis TaxID=472823 RepID=UPI003A8D3B2B
MASVQQGEKQLFEKFWRGTFKAVATPRPESIIVASITARKPVSSGTLRCLPCPAEDRCPEKLSGHGVKETSTTNGCAKGKGRRDHADSRSHSPSCDEERVLPPARGKKKKKKLGHKKRRRSPSYSPTPVKKKKKKKSSKKRKRNRLSSKKRRHSSSSPKSKRKEERKHKKHSRGRARKSHRHRHRHSCSESSDYHSPSCRSRARSREERHKTQQRCSWHHSKSTVKTSFSAEVQASQKSSQSLPFYSFLSPKEVISQSGSSADLFTKTDSSLGNLASQNGEYHEYDSGNDTSSPPSTQTSSSRSKDSQEKRTAVHDGFGHTFSSSKPKLANSDNSSDSGNSFTSCFSQTKGTALENLSPDAQGQEQSFSEKKKRNFPQSPIPSSPLRPCSHSESCTSTGRSSSPSSRSCSSHHKAFPRYSRSRSCSSGKRSSSRSRSYSSKSCKKSPGSRSSRPRRSPSYSRYSPSRDREQEHKHGSSEKESHRERDRRRRRGSYSPLRKRRRDSPSHLEARRITSARKRPIPYYRPSPSSSSSASSYSSWYSSFSRSRSRSYSSYRTSRSRSRSRSWSSSSSAESRSRSRSSGARSCRSRSYDSGGSSNSLRR